MRTGWDEIPGAAAAFTQGQPPQQPVAALGNGQDMTTKMPPIVSSNQFAMMAKGLPAHHVPNKIEVDPKCRIWFGNLLRGTVDGETLNDFLVDLFEKIPQWHERYTQLIAKGETAIKQIELNDDEGGGSRPYAFVELRNEELAATAVALHGAELLGRPIKTGRPTGTAGSLPPPLDVTPLINLGLVPTLDRIMPDGNIKPKNNAQRKGNPVVRAKKQRELYFGNLPVGQIDAEGFLEFLKPTCMSFPCFDPFKGSPPGSPTNAINWATDKYCFVEFQSEEMATAALSAFAGVELMGRVLNVNRPTGFREDLKPLALTTPVHPIAPMHLPNHHVPVHFDSKSHNFSAGALPPLPQHMDFDRYLFFLDIN